MGESGHGDFWALGESGDRSVRQPVTGAEPASTSLRRYHEYGGARKARKHFEGPRNA